MQSRDKWIIVILILIMSMTGLTYYGFCHNDTQVVPTNESPTIIVNGDGSSGTGDVTNTEVQVVSGGTQTVYVEEEDTSAPKNDSGPAPH